MREEALTMGEIILDLISLVLGTLYWGITDRKNGKDSGSRQVPAERYAHSPDVWPNRW